MTVSNAKLKVLLVDDEPFALEVLENYLQNFDELEIVNKCANAVEAFQVLQKTKVDLMFLDIKMPGIKGTELIRSLKSPPKFIFTTAYHDYAVEGFDLDAVDYLLKPVSLSRFLKAMDKVFTNFGIKKSSITAQEPQSPPTSSFVYLKVERKTVKINANDILWIESQGDYIKVMTAEKSLLSKHKISLLEELLPEDQFLRIHRSFIVSVSKVESFHSNYVEVSGKKLPIGRSYKAECISKLKADC